MSRFDGDKELITSTIDTLSRLIKEYPTNKKVTLTVGNLDDEDFAETRNKTVCISNKVLRNRTITEKNNGQDKYFASEKLEDIVAHEYGHILSKSAGNSIEIAREVYYNVNKKQAIDTGLLDWVRTSISEYAYLNFKREIYSEMMARENGRHDEIANAIRNSVRKRVSI